MELTHRKAPQPLLLKCLFHSRRVSQNARLPSRVGGATTHVQLWGTCWAARIGAFPRVEREEPIDVVLEFRTARAAPHGFRQPARVSVKKTAERTKDGGERAEPTPVADTQPTGTTLEQKCTALEVSGLNWLRGTGAADAIQRPQGFRILSRNSTSGLRQTTPEFRHHPELSTRHCPLVSNCGVSPAIATCVQFGTLVFNMKR